MVVPLSVTNGRLFWKEVEGDVNKKQVGRKILIAGFLILIIIAAGVGFWLSKNQPQKKSAQTSPVPKAVAQSVNFPVYYPDPKKLPAGYVLNQNSFSSPVKNGVTYSVIYDGSKKIVFSLQTKPSDSELTSFNSNYIPLRIDFQTPLGQAEIGAYNNHGNTQTLVSLPATRGPWIIITAPYDINQDQLKQVLSALRQ